MNDRFKFRVWDKYIQSYIKENLGEEYVWIEDDGQLGAGIDDSCILEQCTGLKDKNGNLIYEGDVLLCDRKIVDCGTREEIHYKKSGVVQREKNGQYFINGKDWYGSDITFYNECAEIIGNIHETKEK